MIERLVGKETLAPAELVATLEAKLVEKRQAFATLEAQLAESREQAVLADPELPATKAARRLRADLREMIQDLTADAAATMVALVDARANEAADLLASRWAVRISVPRLSSRRARRCRLRSTCSRRSCWWRWRARATRSDRCRRCRLIPRGSGCRLATAGG